MAVCVCVSGETEAHELLCSNNIFSSQKETRFSAWDPPVETCSDQDVARAAWGDVHKAALM